ncbi:hypothetical protein CIB48_g9316 [Xylaria polymorpha]|nr:hypothetical protein CIB48_g9316 [Xylaria polymorpha]
MTTTMAPKSPKAAVPTAPPPLLLTIRFSTALPDLELDIPRPGATTVVSLKHLIRSRLDKAQARRRLRFIHGGKILPDTAVLSSVLRALPPPPPPPTVARRRQGQGFRRKEQRKRQIDTRATAAGAADLRASRRPTATYGVASSHHHPSKALIASGLSLATSTTPAPRGFDRLLSAGFTASEVNQLRLQFRSIHSSRYTPDTLPSPDSFRRMEDAWIDDNGAAMPAGAGMNSSGADGAGGMLGIMGGGGGGIDGEGVGPIALVDMLIRGVITGFIWPLGSAGWLIREEGMSSDRWRFMVATGVVLGVLIGFIRAISGDK